MKSSKINYFIVGLFVIAMVAGLAVAVATLTGRTGATDAYHAIYNNVTGVKFGTQVLYEGYPIGQVESVTPVELDGRMKFRADFTVREGWKIPDDSRVQIASPGLLSAITLSIDAGSSQTAYAPGSELKGQESANIFSVMSSVAGDISDLAEHSVKPLLLNFNNILQGDGQEVFKDVRTVIKDVRTAVAQIIERTPKITENVEQFTGRMNAISDELATFVTPENRKTMEGILAVMNEATANVSKLTVDLEATRSLADKLLASLNDTVDDNRKDVDESIADMRYVVDSLSRHIDSVNQNLDGTARNMYEFSRQIRKNPGLLLGGTPPVDKATK